MRETMTQRFNSPPSSLPRRNPLPGGAAPCSPYPCPMTGTAAGFSDRGSGRSQGQQQRQRQKPNRPRGRSRPNGVPGPFLCSNDLSEMPRLAHKMRTGLPRGARCGHLLRLRGRPPARHRRGRSPPRYPRATTPMVRRRGAGTRMRHSGPEGRGSGTASGTASGIRVRDSDRFQRQRQDSATDAPSWTRCSWSPPGRSVRDV
jgi:hypothetical protein